MSGFVLRCGDSGATLDFAGDVPRGLTGEQGFAYVVTLQTTPLAATVNVYDVRPDLWSAYFADLAASWKGWSGSKDHGSLEGHVRVSATSDAVGHVRLRVVLRGVDAADEWRAEATLHLESGQLRAIAAQARSFFG